MSTALISEEVYYMHIRIALYIFSKYLSEVNAMQSEKFAYDFNLRGYAATVSP